DLSVPDLAAARAPRCLEDGLGNVGGAMKPTLAQVAPTRIQREFAAHFYPPILHEAQRFALATEPEALEPEERVRAEPVVQVGRRHIPRVHARALPEPPPDDAGTVEQILHRIELDIGPLASRALRIPQDVGGRYGSISRAVRTR